MKHLCDIDTNSYVFLFCSGTIYYLLLLFLIGLQVLVLVLGYLLSAFLSFFICLFFSFQYCVVEVETFDIFVLLLPVIGRWMRTG